MDFSEALKTVRVDISIAELQAIVAIIGPTSTTSRRASGISESDNRLLSQIYDDIDDFLNETRGEAGE